MWYIDDAFCLGEVEDPVLGGVLLVVEADVVVYFLLVIWPVVLRQRRLEDEVSPVCRLRRLDLALDHGERPWRLVQSDRLFGFLIFS